jgi:hypothetical protein
MNAAQSFMDKWSSTPQGGGMFGASKIKDVESDYKKLIEYSGQMKDKQKEQGDEWQTWANTVKGWIQQVEDRIDAFKQKLVDLNAILDQEHTLKISTADAEAKIAALGITVTNLLAQFGTVGGYKPVTQTGSGVSEYTAGADTPGGGGPGIGGAIGSITLAGASDGGTFNSPTIIAIAERRPEHVLDDARLKQIVEASSGGGVHLGGITFNGDVSRTDGKKFAREFEDELYARIKDKRSKLSRVINVRN